MKNALIIFVRNPELGKVKTRLAAQIGNVKALEIYIKLLQHTTSVALAADCDKYIFATEPLNNSIWKKHFHIEPQSDGNLGDKMSNAFKKLFDIGYEKVVTIGSDCPDITTSIINQSFTQLEFHDIAIGPANDGGYYLLGMKYLHTKIFEDKSWSSTNVYTDTLKSINSLNLTFYKLETLNDVDEEKDLPISWQ